MVLDLDQALTAIPGVVTTSGAGCATTGTDCDYEIHGGTGNFLPMSAPVPEPASLALFGFALPMLAGVHRRRA